MFNEGVVLQKLMKLQVDKSQGPDGIHPLLLSKCGVDIAKPLIFQKSYDTGVLPKDWSKVTVVPIFKKLQKDR